MASTETSHSKREEEGREPVAFSDHVEAAARLYLQHWICTKEMGFLLDPSILCQSGTKIADIACGSGIWLMEVAETYSQDIQLDGFDISAAHFPPKHELPANVSLSTLDIFEDLPAALHGQYDIVHIARIGLFVQPSRLQLLVTNLKKLLKPNGYIQWEEFDIKSRRLLNLPGIGHPKADAFFTATIPLIRAQGLDFSWIRDLSKHCQEAGFQILTSQCIEVRKARAKPWSDCQLMAYQDMFRNTNLAALAPSRTQWDELLQGLMEECSRGLRITMDIVVVSGRFGMAEAS